MSEKIRSGFLTDDTEKVDYDYNEDQKERQKRLAEQERFLENLTFSQEAKYRCEQTVVTKLNGVIQNHADTKREFLVLKQSTDRGVFVKTKLTDNIIRIYPEALTEALQLINEIDKIKCDTLLQTNAKTGRIERILNKSEIVLAWESHKQYLKNKYSFLRAEKNKENLDNFIGIAEDQILNEQKLINDLNTKLFFDLFFDKYLVTNQGLFEAYSRRFYSQLFEGVSLNLNFKQNIMSESENGVAVSKVGELEKDSYNKNFLENAYDQKFKPIVHYKFSEFNFSYREKCFLNTKEQWIENAEVTIKEEVKNNVQILIDYKLKKIE